MEKKYKLTSPQDNIWLVDRFYNNSELNMIAGILNINSEIDEIACVSAIKKIVENNDAMRINIQFQSNEPCQVITEYEDSVNVNLVNIKCIENKDKYMKEFMREEFNIFNKYLYEFRILKYPSGKGCIMLKMHHIISDAWSVSKIIEQFINNYELIKYNQSNKIEKNLSYIEFIKAEKEYKQSEKYTLDGSFWENYLKRYK